ncbi:PRT6 [Symbiodinium natans]|uniref:E3 ubiquitin-protein ligase n=1 Tax=Symbiodinium natans TaxID=878477 RepID=A0A812K5S5_9DINO|nr:PRT6 [Symbiodinium natans]
MEAEHVWDGDFDKRLESCIWEIFGAQSEEEAAAREAELKESQPRAGVCPVQWGQQDVAFRCLDCELDSNCIQCCDCFFKAPHEGHEVALIRTVGGSCDCGDPHSWAPSGFCPEHCETPQRLDNEESLDLLPPLLRTRAEALVPELMAQVDQRLTPRLRMHGLRNEAEADKTIREKQAALVFGALRRLGEAAFGLRYLVVQELQGDRLANWMKAGVDEALFSEALERFFLLYVQVSPCFKRTFAKTFIRQYDQILQDAPRLDALGVQFLTIPEVAVELVAKEDAFGALLSAANRLLTSVVDHEDENMVFQDPEPLQTNWEKLRSVFHSVGFLCFHKSVCEHILKTPSVLEAIAEVLQRLWRMSPQQRAIVRHVLYETRQLQIQVFTLESEILRYFFTLCDFCRRPQATLEELQPLYAWLVASLQDSRGFLSSFNNASAASFHLPALRLLTLSLNFELLLDPSLADSWRKIFPRDFLVTCIMHTVRTLRFEAEIRAGWWVRNGESMRAQHVDYRTKFRQTDIMTLQAFMILLHMHGSEDTACEPLSCLWTAVFSDDAPSASKPEASVWTSWRRQWVENAVSEQTRTRFRLFWLILCQVLNEMFPIEVAACRRDWEPRYSYRCPVILQRFLIQVLATGPLSLSELANMVPKELQVREGQLAEALEAVATRQDARYVLKQRSWQHFDICMAEAMPIRSWRDGTWRERQHRAEEKALAQEVSMLGPRRADGLTLAPAWQDHLVESLCNSELVPLVVDFIEIQSSFRQDKEAQSSVWRHPAQHEDGSLLHCLKVLDILSDAQSPHVPGAPATLTAHLRLPVTAATGGD